jgi:hypothetical protein
MMVSLAPVDEFGLSSAAPRDPVNVDRFGAVVERAEHRRKLPLIVAMPAGDHPSSRSPIGSVRAV